MSRASCFTQVILCAAVAAGAAGGCSHEGGYNLTWEFAELAPPAAAAVADGGSQADDGGADGGVNGDAAPAADAANDAAVAQEAGVVGATAGCAAHGVFGVRVTGASSDGAGEDTTVPCAPGHFTHRVPAGTWRFVVHALDAEGKFKQPVSGPEPVPPDPGMLNVMVPGPVTIDDGATVDLKVLFTPQPSCRDGIDNNRDGRVDLDDPSCAGDPNGVEK